MFDSSMLVQRSPPPHHVMEVRLDQSHPHFHCQIRDQTEVPEVQLWPMLTKEAKAQ